ncbi:ATP-binding protein [Sphingomonas sp.]|uniref:sensor histidine kinase NtrY-like n=1 Tax=Sphingomonas sp. TaxID=28214 RepID=UPI0037525D84
MGPATGWLASERANGRFYRFAKLAAALVLAAVLLGTIALIPRGAEPGTLISPPLMALLLIANLIPAIVLMVLVARDAARRDAEGRGVGTGQLHTRLVALFSLVAAVPTVVVAIFASLLLQSGLEFWFSNRARTMLENTVSLAQGAYANEVHRLGTEAVTMSGDLGGYLKQLPIDSPRFATGVSYQTYVRSLNEAAVLNVQPSGQVQTLAAVNIYEGMIDQKRIGDALAKLKADKVAEVASPGRVAVLTRLDFGQSTYLYVAKSIDPGVRAQIDGAGRVLGDYRALLNRSRVNQLRFNVALYLGALIIVGLAILAALKLADRLVQPVGSLVNAAGRIEEGDFSVRVPVSETADEIGTLATAFNRMAGRLETQTSALITANSQLDTRRAFIEAVLSSVTAGVLTVDGAGQILLTNRSAETLLQSGGQGLEGRRLADLSPDLAEFLAGEAREANVLVAAGSGQRTLAVKRVLYGGSTVLTFDDITEQLSDQRRAAWSDIARRIAHEIRNPLTPIQLAAERLQRRYGKEVTSDRDTFDRLTETIIRQVGDLRRMVDEFSNFARMPKPVFRDENVHDIARNALFLHEVAHPDIGFSIDPEMADIRLVCDRRQLSQAFTNIVKNSVEAIEARRTRGEASPDGDRVALSISQASDELVVEISDTGVGLPEDRERLTEPYMTTRVRGTGLGLAIVQKIIEEHLGTIVFLDRDGGGTRVRIAFDSARLAALADKAGEGAEEVRMREDREDPNGA